MIIFIGQNPANKMKKGDKPFEGTKSKETLTKWFKHLDIVGKQAVFFFNASDKPGNVTPKDFNKEVLDTIKQYNGLAKFVALGNYASKFLDSADIKHVKLPHPSPRNVLLNNKRYVTTELNKVKRYLNGY